MIANRLCTAHALCRLRILRTGVSLPEGARDQEAGDLTFSLLTHNSTSSDLAGGRLAFRGTSVRYAP